MIGQTTALAAKEALIALFQGVVSTPTEVHFNRPNSKHQYEENVYVTDVTKGHREFKTLGPPRPNQIEETYQVTVEIEVQRMGTDAQGTEARAWEIARLLETAITEDVTLDGLDHIQTVAVADFEQKSEGGQDGWGCLITLNVAVTARI